MDNKKTINVVKNDGSSVSASLVASIKNNDTNNEYVIYTQNEINNNVEIIYIGKISNTGNISNDEWSSINEYMRNILKGNDIGNISYIKSLDSITLVDEKKLAMPVNYDFVKKQSDLYYSGIISDDSSITADDNKEVVSENTINDIVDNSLDNNATQDTPIIDTPSNETYMDNNAKDNTNETITDVNVESNNISSTNTLIDVEEIKKRYDEMRKHIDELENMEIEAANRYNDTIRLNDDHIKQHIDTMKDMSSISSEPVIEPVNTVVPEMPVNDTDSTDSTTTQAPVSETNWFDIPHE